MSLKDQIIQERLPKHVAVIMDGNGRWAKKQGNNRVYGHRNGVTSVRQTVEASAELGINYLTLYAFSTENWRRPQHEIDALMALLISTVDNEMSTLMENNVRLRLIGDLASMPDHVMEKLSYAVNQTASNTGLTLILALSYSARWEMVNAAQHIAEAVKHNQLAPEDIDHETFTNFLTTRIYPDPELLIRTSGEQRLSNFLMWQLAYAELYFTETLWPDFRKEHYYSALLDFQNRERRFGKTSEQLKINHVNNASLQTGS